MKSSTKNWMNFIFLFLTLAVVMYIGLSGNDLASLLEALRSVSPFYLVLCLLAWAGYVLMDALTVYYFLLRQDYKISLLKAIYISVIGIYYSNITPGASGGQPVQIYRMKQMGVPIGISSSCLTVKFTCFQFMLLVVGTILWIVHRDFVAIHAQGMYWFILLGYFFNFISIGVLLMMAISRRVTMTIITLCIKVGTKLQIVKDPERSHAKWEVHCISFSKSVQMIRNHPRELLVQCLIAVTQLLMLMSITLAVYHSFGLTTASNMEVITMGVLLYISASYTPLPGASGVMEGGFAVFFKGIFPEASLFVGLIIWRSGTYYISLLLGVVVSIWESIRAFAGKKTARDKTAPFPAIQEPAPPAKDNEQEGVSNPKGDS